VVFIAAIETLKNEKNQKNILKKEKYSKKTSFFSFQYQTQNHSPLPTTPFNKIRNKYCIVRISNIFAPRTDLSIPI
jgi:hypothetical protein